MEKKNYDIKRYIHDDMYLYEIFDDSENMMVGHIISVYDTYVSAEAIDMTLYNNRIVIDFNESIVDPMMKVELYNAFYICDNIANNKLREVDKCLFNSAVEKLSNIYNEILDYKNLCEYYGE